ncbi:preprotein translocase subunit YajC [Clostridiales bacterium PH28_bin88]|nr:preprotein translocase subunit YajC [Clostridiales bacterium PH28_bin88]
MQQWAGTFGYLLVFFAILYFMMIRPQQRQQKQRREMLSRVKTNDHIVTIGGIHGRITRVKEDRVTVRIADKVEVELEKSAIGSVLSQVKEKETEKDTEQS